MVRNIFSVACILFMVSILTSCGPEPVEFTDTNLESAVRMAISKIEGDIYQEDLEGLTRLDISERGIIHLDGLDQCPNLTELIAFSNKITDISVLSSLTKLSILELSHNEINDLTP